jgi:hypothetical protein
MRALILLIAILISACSTEPEEDDPARIETARQDGPPQDARCAPGGYWTTFSWGEGCAYPDLEPPAPK